MVQDPARPTIVRPEEPSDHAAIRDVNIAAFQHHPFSRQTEHLIVEELRAAGALEVSLVAAVDGCVVGHIAFSAAGMGATSSGWYLLGPVAVLPERQGRGIGRALVEAGLDELRARHAAGCVLVGDPAFYCRFGFRSYDRVTYAGVPAEYVLGLALTGDVPAGEVRHHPAFSVEA
jgi:putative acetyltransferase